MAKKPKGKSQQVKRENPGVNENPGKSQKGKSKDPENPDAWLSKYQSFENQGSTKFRKKEYDTALKRFASALAWIPEGQGSAERAGLHVSRAACLFSKTPFDVDAVMYECDLALHYDPSLVEPVMLQAQAFRFKAGNFLKKGFGDINQLLKIDSGDFYALDIQEMLKPQRGATEHDFSAAPYYVPPSIEGPAAEDIKALVKEGNRLYQLKEYVSACTLYSKAITLLSDPESNMHKSFAFLHSDQAVCDLKIGEFERAVDACDLAIKCDSELRIALLLRAEACAYLGKFNYVQAMIRLEALIGEQNVSEIQKKKELSPEENFAVDAHELYAKLESTYGCFTDVRMTLQGTVGRQIDGLVPPMGVTEIGEEDIHVSGDCLPPHSQLPNITFWSVGRQIDGSFLPMGVTETGEKKILVSGDRLESENLTFGSVGQKYLTSVVRMEDSQLDAEVHMELKPPDSSDSQLQLFVGNLPYKRNDGDDLDDADIEEFFVGCGNITEIISSKTIHGKFKGYYHLKFDTKNASKEALQRNNVKMYGRPIVVLVKPSAVKLLDFLSDHNTQKKCSIWLSGINTKGISTNEEVIGLVRQHFGGCGEIVDVRLAWKEFKFSNNKDFLIVFSDETAVREVYKRLEFRGSMLKVNEGKPDE